MRVGARRGGTADRDVRHARLGHPPAAAPRLRNGGRHWQPSEAWLYDRNGRLIDSSRVDYQARRLGWVRLADVSQVARDTLVAAEDRRFRSHRGVDWWALGGALRDRAEGKRARGASTLSMQVAAYLAPDLAAPGHRGTWDKFRQMRAGRALEAAGARTRSSRPISTSPASAARRRGSAPPRSGCSARRRRRSLATMRCCSRPCFPIRAPDRPKSRGAPVRSGATRIAAASPARRRRCSARRAASRSIRGSRRIFRPSCSTKPGAKITSTLDARIQSVAIAALRRQLQGLGGTRARDGAVVVVDNASGDVLAYVGGIGGESTAPAVDGASSYRQAGSTLKPFLYAQAIEKGYLTAASILDDSPVQLDTASGLYVPQNYDKAFKGPVSARVALAGSLNVPAVRTLLLTGVDSFRDRLWDTGYRGLVEDGQYYGYSLALGSAEVTLLEQVAAYRSLALGGRWSPLRLTGKAPREALRQITSPQAAWIVADILADPNARAGTFGIDSALRLPFWAAAKTGTSKAMRDNWCIGFSDRFTVGVWVGNLEGDPMRAVSGTSGAAPVWRDVMMALHAGRARPAAGRRRRSRRARSASPTGIEQPRREYFLKGTALTQVASAPETARRPRIVNPVAGSVYALDPTFRSIASGSRSESRAKSSGIACCSTAQDLGTADSRPLVLPQRGQHRLRLVDLGGRVVDQILFTVR
jgi:penicillin-binding protein 1C